jgi:L-amino acid N-acyltransferase YncA
MDNMIIRNAQDSDLPTLTKIYNNEVLEGVSTFDLTPKSIAVRRLWLEGHNATNHPLIVAQIGNDICGYASLSPYREKDAYASTVELSVYIDKKFRNKGIAKKLLTYLIDHAKQQKDIHTIISVITGGNAASEHLHRELGFTCCGTLKEVGFKFGRYLDIVNYQLVL